MTASKPQHILNGKAWDENIPMPELLHTSIFYICIFEYWRAVHLYQKPMLALAVFTGRNLQFLTNTYKSIEFTEYFFSLFQGINGGTLQSKAVAAITSTNHCRFS